MRSVWLALVLIVTTTASAWSDVPVERIVRIECTDASGDVSLGTGIVLDNKGNVLTAKHVSGEGSQCFGSVEPGERPHKRLLQGRKSQQYDAQLLRFVTPPNLSGELTYRSVTDNAPLVAYGFPEDGVDDLVLFTGVAQTTDPDDQGFIRTSLMTSRGTSGGPVFGADGALLGIVAGAKIDNLALVTTYSVLPVDVFAQDLGIFRTLEVETLRSRILLDERKSGSGDSFVHEATLVGEAQTIVMILANFKAYVVRDANKKDKSGHGHREVYVDMELQVDGQTCSGNTDRYNAWSDTWVRSGASCIVVLKGAPSNLTFKVINTSEVGKMSVFNSIETHLVVVQP